MDQIYMISRPGQSQTLLYYRKTVVIIKLIWSVSQPLLPLVLLSAKFKRLYIALSVIKSTMSHSFRAFKISKDIKIASLFQKSRQFC